jgi:hypothetical protein
VGWATVDADPLPVTPRRPLSEVVDWEEVRNVRCCK